MQIQRVVVFGGSGFLGTALVNALSGLGVTLCVPTRSAGSELAVATLPQVEVAPVPALRDPAVLAGLLRGADAVVNLVGVLHGPFEGTHVELPGAIATACVASGVRRLVHISALGADAQGPSAYLRSKAAGEAAIRAAAGDALEWTILRPSVMFGPHDHFLNLFAGLAGSFPVLPLAGAGARFQPVYVDDVVRCVVHALLAHAGVGEVLETAGPQVYTLRELVRYAARLAGHRTCVIGLPEGLGMLLAGLMALAPNPPMSPDNLRSMRRDNVAGGTPLPFGFEPVALEAVAPLYLGDAGQRRHYYAWRQHARRG